MSETTLIYRSQIPAPPAAVLAWHANPGAFERLTPPWMDVRVLEAAGGIAPGDWKRLRLAAGPIGVSWKLVHEAGSDGAAFVDVQERGPFRSWRHEHWILPNGTEASYLEDRLTYRLPWTPVGRWAADRFLRNRLDDLFRFRHRRTQIDVARHAGAGPSMPLRIAVTGASGLVGRQLVPFLRAGGHDVVTLVRRRPTGADERFWDPATGQIDADALEGLDAVVHLAGESIAGGRWTPARKEAILASRIQGTGLLAETLVRLRQPPRVFVSASAIGYYGDGGSSVLTEDSPQGSGFLANVCRAWEEAAAPAADAGIRVVHPRTGVVLAGNGGLLANVGWAFRFGVGGPLGSGEQLMSWIALDDLLGVFFEAIINHRLEGPVNAVAPLPVTNRTFAGTLGRVLGRPAVLRAPATVLRLVAGELAQELLLASQSARPARLEQVGFRFAFPTIEDALRHELGEYDERPAGDVCDRATRPALRSDRWR
jgi:uncharacterized protein (TIGR01777 family)